MILKYKNFRFKADIDQEDRTIEDALKVLHYTNKGAPLNEVIELAEKAYFIFGFTYAEIKAFFEINRQQTEVE